MAGWPSALPREVHRGMRQIHVGDPWFSIYQVVDGVYAICEPLHYEETISYLISGEASAVLLDTGMGIADIKEATMALTKLPVQVVNTHWHYDHVGGNSQFGEVWAFDNDFEVAKIERGMPYPELSQKLQQGTLCGDLPNGFNPNRYEIGPCKVSRRLRHLDEIDLGGRALKVHHTPGHSPGSVCLLDSASGILFTGDTYYPGRLFANLERSDFGVFASSLAYLAKLVPVVSFLAPSHNEAKVPASEILHASDAFGQVRSGSQKPDRVQNRLAVYEFGRFSLERWV